jgi:hypothetical protein
MDTALIWTHQKIEEKKRWFERPTKISPEKYIQQNR